MYGDDSKETIWVNVAPGVAFEVEYEFIDYEIAATGDDEVSGRLTGRVRMLKDAARDAQWGNPFTSEEREGDES